MGKTAFIWDLDGTLLDSYEVIVASLYKTYEHYHILMNKGDILKEVMTTSVRTFIAKTEVETGISFDVLKDTYSAISEQEKKKIRPIPHAAEILAFLKEQGIRNYVFTHRGTSTEPVLKNIGLFDFFEEIITGADGFERKPSPEALQYLMTKHNLSQDDTVYVGDRTLDVECAQNAGISSILYLPKGSVVEPTGMENHIVTDLLDIKDCIGKMD